MSKFMQLLWAISERMEVDGVFSRWLVLREQLWQLTSRWPLWARLALGITTLLAMKNDSSIALYFYSAWCSLVYLWDSLLKWFTILRGLTMDLTKMRSLKSSFWCSETSSIKDSQSMSTFKTRLPDFSISNGKTIKTIFCWAQKTSKFILSFHVTAS